MLLSVADRNEPFPRRQQQTPSSLSERRPYRCLDAAPRQSIEETRILLQPFVRRQRATLPRAAPVTIWRWNKRDSPQTSATVLNECVHRLQAIALRGHSLNPGPLCHQETNPDTLAYPI